MLSLKRLTNLGARLGIFQWCQAGGTLTSNTFVKLHTVGSTIKGPTSAVPKVVAASAHAGTESLQGVVLAAAASGGLALVQRFGICLLECTDNGLQAGQGVNGGAANTGLDAGAAGAHGAAGQAAASTTGKTFGAQSLETVASGGLVFTTGRVILFANCALSP